MSYVSKLHKHYSAVSTRLNDFFVGNKLPWSTPHIELIWWRPSITEIHLHIPGAPLSLQIIATRITLEHGVSWDSILSHIYPKPIVHARHHLYYLAMRDTKISGASLSKYFQRDHSTVTYGAEAHAKRHELEIPRPKQVRMHRNSKIRPRNNKGRFLGRDCSE